MKKKVYQLMIKCDIYVYMKTFLSIHGNVISVLFS